MVECKVGAVPALPASPLRTRGSVTSRSLCGFTATSGVVHFPLPGILCCNVEYLIIHSSDPEASSTAVVDLELLTDATI